MPRRIIMIGLICILMISASSSILLAIDNNIKLKINNKLITDDLDYQIKKGNILVPLGIFTDNLDIKVKTFVAIDTIQLKFDNKTIKLRVGDKNLQVGDKIIQMESAVRRVANQIMIPLKDVGNALGLVIKSFPEEKIVSISEYRSIIERVNYPKNSNYEGLELVVSEGVEYELRFLPMLDQLILELKGVVLDNKFKKIGIKSSLVKDFKIQEFGNASIRFNLHLSTNVDYRLEENSDDGKARYLLKLSPIITDLNYSQERINITATGDLKSNQVTYLSNPRRVVIDINKAALEEAQELELKDHPSIKKIRLSQFKTDPCNVVRAVLDLKENIRVNIDIIDNQLAIIPINDKLLDIDYSEEDEYLLFKFNNKVQPEIFPLIEGDRLVFDLPYTINNIKDSKIEVNNDIIEEIRVSQFNQNKTRVVVDLVRLVPYDLKWENDNLRIELINNVLDVDLTEKRLETQFELSLLKDRDYKVYKLINPNRLVIDIFDTMIDLNEIELPQAEGLIKDIRVSQFSNHPNQVRVVLELDQSVGFEVYSKEISNQIQIGLIKENLRSYIKDKTIVVDAGHGGHDPGALGTRGKREKDIVFDIALKLEGLLVEAGAEVIMTRRDDVYVELSDRAKIANSVNGDVFISIHANAHPDLKHKGTETYISSTKDQSSLLLANLTQKALLKELKLYDRGVKVNDLYVLENTKVPAILNEIAFMSNPEEESMLLDNIFREKAAIALYKGINNYFRVLSD